MKKDSSVGILKATWKAERFMWKEGGGEWNKQKWKRKTYNKKSPE